MGLFLRPRRPLLRLAAGALTDEEFTAAKAHALGL